MMAIQHTIKAFNELTTTELYQILHLRSRVFVVEQNSVYLDPDNKDFNSHHLSIYANGNLAAYARLLPAGLSYPNDVSIGRVVSDSAYRGLGLGNKLMNLAVEGCYELFGPSDIRISAQLYLLKFYQSHGFTEVGESYLEDGIPHIEMVKAV